MFITVAVVLPILYVLVMNLIEGLVDPLPWQRRFAKVGWDLCVLALGLIGGIFSSTDVLKNHLPIWAVVNALLAVALSLGFATIIAYLRRGAAAGWKGWLSLALGGAAVAVPTYVAVRL